MFQGLRASGFLEVEATSGSMLPSFYRLYAGLAIIEVRLCNVHVWVLVHALLSMEEFPEPFKAIRHSHVRTRAHCSKGVSGMYWVRLEVRRCHV